MPRLPVLFVSHGAPDLALKDSSYTRALSEFGRRLRPRAILVVSAHWEQSLPVRVSGSPRLETIHDFSGFPRELHALTYPAAGDPRLAAEVADRLEGSGLPAAIDPGRGLDHGAWVPLRFLYPSADVPVVGVSLPRPREPSDVVRMGRALQDLPDEDVLVVGSGGVVHNLARLRFREADLPVEPWAREFEAWVLRKIEARDEASLVSYREQAPSADLAAPTPEHFDPLLFAFGASRPGDRVEKLHEGFELGSLSLCALAFQPEDSASGAQGSSRRATSFKKSIAR